MKRAATFEKELCEQLLDISRLMYATVPSKSLPTGRQVVSMKDMDREGIRECICDNLQFIRTTYKYMLLDREASIRESKETG